MMLPPAPAATAPGDVSAPGGSNVPGAARVFGAALALAPPAKLRKGSDLKSTHSEMEVSIIPPSSLDGLFQGKSQ